MTLSDDLRTLAAEIRLRHLEGQLGQPWALTEGADYIDALKAHNVAHAITIADQAYRIGQLEAERDDALEGALRRIVDSGAYPEAAEAAEALDAAS